MFNIFSSHCHFKISFCKTCNTFHSWLSSEPSNKLFDNHMKDEKSTLPPPVTGLGSLKDAPPLGGLGKNASLTQSPLGRFVYTILFFTLCC